MPEICPRYAQVMPKMCPTYARDMLKICPWYARDMPKICPWHAQDMPKICTGYAKVTPEIYPRYAHDMPKICPRYICPRYAQDMLTELKNIIDGVTESPTWIQEILAHLKISLYNNYNENVKSESLKVFSWATVEDCNVYKISYWLKTFIAIGWWFGMEIFTTLGPLLPHESQSKTWNEILENEFSVIRKRFYRHFFFFTSRAY